MYRDETKNLNNMVQIIESQGNNYTINDFPIGTFVFCEGVEYNSTFTVNGKVSCFVILSPSAGFTANLKKWDLFTDIFSPRYVTNLNSFTVGERYIYNGDSSYKITTYRLLILRIS